MSPLMEIVLAWSLWWLGVLAATGAYRLLQWQAKE